MNEAIRRWVYCLLITESVIFTPLVGIFGPLENGGQSNSLPREYFLPAGVLSGTFRTRVGGRASAICVLSVQRRSAYLHW